MDRIALERKRLACKGWATRTANSVINLLARTPETVNMIKLSQLLTELDTKLANLYAVQSDKCEMLSFTIFIWQVFYIVMAGTDE